ncbi:MAG: hypothetical protein ACI4TM_04930 [Candidatus Cryptobacteroides sp.]
MKKLYLMMVPFAAMIMAASCAKEEVGNADETRNTVEVIVSLDDEITRAGFSDKDGIFWKEGDVLIWDGDGKYESAELTSDKISNGGHTANFYFDAALTESDRTDGWFCTKNNHTGGNTTQVEFTRYTSGSTDKFVQEEAGVMNSEYIFLHSGTTTMNITKDVPPVFNMAIAGSIFRFIPYTQSFNEESIISVKMESNSNLIGTVQYERKNAIYTGASLWDSKKSLTVTLGTSFSLAGVTSAETSKGIYMAIPATASDSPLNGYSYIVTTDKAEYTFNAMEKTLAVAENTVKNVFLNLDKATKRVGNDDFKGYVYYEGNPGDLSVNWQEATHSNGYSVAKVSDVNGENFVTREDAGDEKFYDATIKYYYENGEEIQEVDRWLTVKFKENDHISNYQVICKANTEATTRVAKVTVSLNSNIEGYTVITSASDKTPKTYSYEFKVTQTGYSDKKILTFDNNLPKEVTVGADAATIEWPTFGWLQLKVDGTGTNEFNDTNTDFWVEDESGNKITVDWMTDLHYKSGDRVWEVTFTANNTSSPRTAYVVCKWKDLGDEYKWGEGYETEESRTFKVKVTQKAAEAE